MRYKFTLTRWHKIAERIHVALKEREANVKTAFTATTLSPWNRAGAEDKAADIAGRAAADLALIERGAQTIAEIRAALSGRNAQLGISGKLAEAESANRCAALYKAVLEGQRADMVHPRDLHALPADLVGDSDSWGFGRRTAFVVTLRTADRPLVDELRAKLEREQARATRLLDEVADLNRAELELDVGQEIARIAALAA